MDISGKKVLVAGTGISGIGAVTLLSRIGAYPILFDERQTASAEDVREKLPVGIQCDMITGKLPEKIEVTVSLVVVSPGIPADAPFLNRFTNAGIPIVGELELGYAFSKGRVVAITGTNGKTTTTALTGRILKDYYESVFIVGNIGRPYTADALAMTEQAITVAEVSSFQLETTDHFHPTVVAILNITPDHLDRHHTMEAYASVKQSITKNQTKQDMCVLNYENTYTREFGLHGCPASVIFFSSKRKLSDGYYLEDDIIWHAKNGKSTKLIHMQEVRLPGVHNAENVMAAIAMAVSMGVPKEHALRSVKAFRAVEHRIEYVASKKGVDYYNDSKGTNPDAAVKAIQAMVKPTILIGGGCDKRNAYDAWIEAFDGKVKWLILIGETKEKITQCARAHGFQNILQADSMAEAVKLSGQKAEAGDAVLLSPACASFDMFPNYEVRGNVFKSLVNQIEE